MTIILHTGSSHSRRLVISAAQPGRLAHTLRRELRLHVQQYTVAFGASLRATERSWFRDSCAHAHGRARSHLRVECKLCHRSGVIFILCASAYPGYFSHAEAQLLHGLIVFKDGERGVLHNLQIWKGQLFFLRSKNH